MLVSRLQEPAPPISRQRRLPAGGQETRAADAINDALSAGWGGLPIAHRAPLTEMARAHEVVERPSAPGRVVVEVSSVP